MSLHSNVSSSVDLTQFKKRSKEISVIFRVSWLWRQTSCVLIGPLSSVENPRHSLVVDKRLMIPLAQANSQLSKPQLRISPVTLTKSTDSLSVVRVLKCNRNLRTEPKGNVLSKCYWNGIEKKQQTYMGFPLFGNKMSCFCKQNFWVLEEALSLR